MGTALARPFTTCLRWCELHRSLLKGPPRLLQSQVSGFVGAGYAASAPISYTYIYIYICMCTIGPSHKDGAALLAVSQRQCQSGFSQLTPQLHGLHSDGMGCFYSATSHLQWFWPTSRMTPRAEENKLPDPKNVGKQHAVKCRAECNCDKRQLKLALMAEACTFSHNVQGSEFLDPFKVYTNTHHF